MRVEEQQLKSFLLDSNIITKGEFEKAQEKAIKEKKELEEILVSDDYISEKELGKLKAYILGIPFINLENKKIDPEILKIIPEPIARSNNIMAFRKNKNKLEVAMIDPKDLETIDFIKKKAGLKILPRLTTVESIKNILRQYEETLKAEFGKIIEDKASEVKILKEEGKKEKKAEELEEIAEEVPIIKIVDTLLKHAILQRASDVHIEPQEKELLVRYRIDGVLRDAMTLPKKIASGIVARIKILSDLKLDEHRLPQDGRFKIEGQDYKYSVRVSILPVANGEKVVMRLLLENIETFSLEQLGLRGEALENIQRAIKEPTGMILVTGPTGSGKTTTLYTILDILNTPQVNISTTEDPIEYQVPRINQTQVKPDIGLTFAEGLRSLVRQDPDILMVGEIRDAETASLAVNAALTGHLLLSTLHTTNAAGTVTRLIDIGVEPFLISSTLNVIIAQRLVRRLCSSKKGYNLDKDEVKNLSKYIDVGKTEKMFREEGIINRNQNLKDVEFYKPVDSEDCQGGYKGRIGIYEVLPVTETIKEMISSKKDSDKIQKQAIKEGMKTMVEDGFIKAARGITSIEEVLRVIME